MAKVSLHILSAGRAHPALAVPPVLENVEAYVDLLGSHDWICDAVRAVADVPRRHPGAVIANRLDGGFHVQDGPVAIHAAVPGARLAQLLGREEMLLDLGLDAVAAHHHIGKDRRAVLKRKMNPLARLLELLQPLPKLGHALRHERHQGIQKVGPPHRRLPRRLRLEIHHHLALLRARRPHNLKPRRLEPLVPGAIGVGGDEGVVDVADLRIDERHGPVRRRADG
jgi:hypothetical protein